MARSCRRGLQGSQIRVFLLIALFHLGCSPALGQQRPCVDDATLCADVNEGDPECDGVVQLLCPKSCALCGKTVNITSACVIPFGSSECNQATPLQWASICAADSPTTFATSCPITCASCNLAAPPPPLPAASDPPAPQPDTPALSPATPEPAAAPSPAPEPPLAPEPPPAPEPLAVLPPPAGIAQPPPVGAATPPLTLAPPPPAPVPGNGTTLSTAKGSSNAGAIGGGVGGGVAAVVALVLGGWCLSYRRRRHQQQLQHDLEAAKLPAQQVPAAAGAATTPHGGRRGRHHGQQQHLVANGGPNGGAVPGSLVGVVAPGAAAAYVTGPHAGPSADPTPRLPSLESPAAASTYTPPSPATSVPTATAPGASSAPAGASTGVAASTGGFGAHRYAPLPGVGAAGAGAATAGATAYTNNTPWLLPEVTRVAAPAAAEGPSAASPESVQIWMSDGLALESPALLNPATLPSSSHVLQGSYPAIGPAGLPFLAAAAAVAGISGAAGPAAAHDPRDSSGARRSADPSQRSQHPADGGGSGGDSRGATVRSVAAQGSPGAPSSAYSAGLQTPAGVPAAPRGASVVSGTTTPPSRQASPKHGSNRALQGDGWEGAESLRQAYLKLSMAYDEDGTALRPNEVARAPAPETSPFEAAQSAAAAASIGLASARPPHSHPGPSPAGSPAVTSPTSDVSGHFDRNQLMGAQLRPGSSVMDLPAKAKTRLDLTLHNDVAIFEDQVLGRGGMGVVYRGHYNDEEVAVKVIQPQAGDLMVDVQDFVGEINILARLDHANVVSLLGGCMQLPQMFLVEELMVGSVADVLYGRLATPLPLMQGLKLAADILCGLEYLHSMRVVHRDLKPPNVLLAPDGTAKISDFGLARGKYKTYLSTKHMDAGTVAYMAPECFNPDFGRITTATDIFSFGVILWELLAQRRPWENTSHATIIFRVVFQDARMALPTDPVKCPPRLANLVRRCWAAQPAARPNASQALIELVHIMEEMQPTSSHSVSTRNQAAAVQAMHEQMAAERREALLQEQQRNLSCRDNRYGQ